MNTVLFPRVIHNCMIFRQIFQIFKIRDFNSITILIFQFFWSHWELWVLITTARLKMLICKLLLYNVSTKTESRLTGR